MLIIYAYLLPAPTSSNDAPPALEKLPADIPVVFLKLGICGEHGGDPKSIIFCSKAGLNYVSCSPYRVPVARLAAAQAELKRNK